jgi:regulator of protease activity HflC (stomatin/prohibitin superfamily)
VQRAEQDEDKMLEQANQYANKIRGEARTVRPRRSAKTRRPTRTRSSRKRSVNRSGSSASTRNIVKAPDITRKRLYLETMEKVLSSSKKVITDDQGSTNGVLPLPAAQRPRQGQGYPGSAEMSNRIALASAPCSLLLFLAYSSFFVVNQRQQAIVIRFGQITDVKTSRASISSCPSRSSMPTASSMSPGPGAPALRPRQHARVQVSRRQVL